jgi:hypothetical protein
MSNILLNRTCPNCRVDSGLSVDKDKYFEWREGRKNVQDIFPDLDTHERELLLTGYCYKCWDKLFSFEGGEE